MQMQKYYYWLLVALFSLQIRSEITHSDNLSETNQRILDVFKGTEFDIDDTEEIDPSTQPSPIGFGGQAIKGPLILSEVEGAGRTGDVKSVRGELVEPYFETKTEESNLPASQFKLENPNAVATSIDSFMFRELLDSCSGTLLNDIHNTIHLSQHKYFQNISYRDRFTKLLLVGPQGSGKSSLALAIAAALNRPYVFVSAASLANEYKNSAIRIINDLFDPLIESEIAAVVILDEITAFTKRFADKNDSDPGAVEHLWVKLDACKQNPHLLVIFTANSTDAIPDTIKDRLSASKFYISHPDTNARKRILKNYLSEHCLFSSTFYDTLAKDTKGFSLRELNMLISRAKNKALSRAIRKNIHLQFLDIQKADIESALKMLQTSHNAEIKSKNKAYYKEIFSTVSPHIIPFVNMLISTYLQVKFHNQQMEFTKSAHEQSMQHQRLVHWDTMTHMIENADRQNEFQNKNVEKQKLLEEKHNQETTMRNMRQNIGTTVNLAITAGTGGHPIGIAAGAAANLVISNITEIEKTKPAQIIIKEVKNLPWHNGVGGLAFLLSPPPVKLAATGFFLLSKLQKGK